MIRLTDKQEQRFFDKVDIPLDPDGCHEWTGYSLPEGYGRFYAQGKHHLAHRVAFMIEHGREPEGLVLHSCDNPCCVRSDHLREGTNSDNMNDMYSRDRRKLTKQQRRDICDMYATGFHSQLEVAAQFGVCEMAVNKIVNGKVHHIIGAC